MYSRELFFGPDLIYSKFVEGSGKIHCCLQSGPCFYAVLQDLFEFGVNDPKRMESQQRQDDLTKLV